MKIFQASLIFFIIIAASSCATKKKYRMLEMEDNEISLDSIYQNIFHSEKSDWFSGKARITVEESSGTTKALMFVRMKRDSLIWSVYKKLSIEAARSQITKDSFYIIYRQEKKYDVRPLDSMGHIYGFEAEFDFMSDLINGIMPSIDSSRLWNQKENPEHYSFRSMHNDLVLDFDYDKKTGMLLSGKYYDRFGRTGNWIYSDYRMINQSALPFLREFHVKFANGETLGIKMEFLEIETDIEYDIRFDIPGHYEKLN